MDTPQPSPAQSMSYTHQAQDGTITDKSHFEYQHPPQMLDTPMDCEPGEQWGVEGGLSDKSSSHSAGVDGNKRKRSPTPHEIGRGGKKRPKREKKPRDPETLKFISVGTPQDTVARP